MKHLAAVPIVLLALVAPSRADVISETHTGTIDPSTFVVDLLFQSFDSSRGILNSITWSYSFTSSATGNAANVNTDPRGDSEDATFQLDTDVGVLAIGVDDNLVRRVKLTVSLRPEVANPPFPLAADASGGNGLPPLAAYIDSGMIPINFRGFAVAQFIPDESGPNVVGNINADPIQVSATLQFDFTPTAVPEPSSLALLGLMAGGSAVWGWRRRKAAHPAAA